MSKRVSCIKGDPGERLYAEACGGGKTVRVYLEGVEQNKSVTADESEGFVERVVTTPDGNVAFNSARGEIMHEVVYGNVEIVIE